MSFEQNSLKIKKKKKHLKKPLPKNVFEIVGESGQLVERVDSNINEKKPTKIKTKEIEAKQKFSERTQKRRVK